MTDRLDEILKEERRAGRQCEERCRMSRFCIGVCLYVKGHPLPPTGVQHACRKHFELEADAYAQGALRHD